MKTVEFKTADGRTRYYLAGEEGLPAEPVLKFLKFRDAAGYARNTLKGECMHLMHYFEFLEERGKAYEEVSIDDIARFVGWLKNPDIEKKIVSLREKPAHAAETINKHEEMENRLPEKLAAFIKRPSPACRGFLYGIADSKPVKCNCICALSALSFLHGKKIICNFFRILGENSLRIHKNLRKVTSYAAKHEARFMKLLTEQTEDGSKRRNAAKKKELEAAEKRIAELSAIFKRLYEDSVTGRISDERFTELSADYEAEQKELKERAAALQGELSRTLEATANAEKFMKVVRKYTSFEELTPTLLREFVEKIVIHESEALDGKRRGKLRRQEIEIYYSFVGKVELPD